MSSPKKRIIETASVLFANQGYNSTGINQIISEAHVAKASFYQHFKSKEDLCVAFLVARHEYWFNKLNEFVNNEQDLKNKVVSSFDFLIYMNITENFRGCSFLNVLSEIQSDNVKLLSPIQRHKADLRAFFKSLIANEILSDHIYLLFESCITESKMFKSNELIEKSKSIINNLIN